MSSSTTLTFIFPELTTLEVTIGNGVVPARLEVAENKSKTFSDIEALRLMQDSNVNGVMSGFDLSLLNLLIDRHNNREHFHCQECVMSGATYFPSTGLYLRVSHHR
ncbi:hypothetical protein HOT49_gp266 [Erwinia phage vB_EamM_Alexandra]|uniref:Uncharacterized protein n=1 Tax=Erwinia phage vB_EamM_Alexandra TaxID=2201424 RepID=A0A2Z4QE33_9CAUD|nr:hypothetical protein HOT49_gp266 [Erwinia phage vB_EamM_Alexandra]AWY08525.1 hypothetical protein Alexandra_268 [Erwinia phage vB_EamM_Alexandra]